MMEKNLKNLFNHVKNDEIITISSDCVTRIDFTNMKITKKMPIKIEYKMDDFMCIRNNLLIHVKQLYGAESHINIIDLDTTIEIKRIDYKFGHYWRNNENFLVSMCHDWFSVFNLTTCELDKIDFKLNGFNHGKSKILFYNDLVIMFDGTNKIIKYNWITKKVNTELIDDFVLIKIYMNYLLIFKSDKIIVGDLITNKLVEYLCEEMSDAEVYKNKLICTSGKDVLISNLPVIKFDHVVTCTDWVIDPDVIQKVYYPEVCDDKIIINSIV